MNTSVSMQQSVTDTKLCTKCHENKEVTQFYKNAGMKDGRLNMCSACSVKATAQWRKENDPDGKKRYQQTDIAKKAKERVSAGIRSQYGTGRDKEKAAIRSQRYIHKRRPRVEIEMNEWDSFVVDEVIRVTQLRTTATGFPWNLDHVVPLNHKTASGLHNAFNVQSVPASWNVKKGNRNMNSFWPLPEQTDAL